MRNKIGRFTWDFGNDQDQGIIFDSQKASLKEGRLYPWEAQVISRAVQDVVDSIANLLGIDKDKLESDRNDSP